MSRRGRNSPKFSLFAFQDIITSLTGILILITLILALELMQRVEDSSPAKTDRVNSQVKATIAANNASISQLEAELRDLQDQASQSARFDVAQIREQLKGLSAVNRDLEQQMVDVETQRQDAAKDLDTAKMRIKGGPDSHDIEETLKDAKAKAVKLKELREANRVIFNPSQHQAKTPWLAEFDGTTVKVAQVGISAPPQVFSNIGQFNAWAKGRRTNSEYFVLLPKPSGIEMYYQAKDALETLGFDVGFDLLGATQTAINDQTGAEVK